MGASVSITLNGEVDLPHATLTAIERNTYDEKLQQLHDYLANATGLGANASDYITASFGLSDNPVRANFSWDKVVDSSLDIDLDRLRDSSVHSIRVHVAPGSPSNVIDPTAAVAVIAVLASLLCLLLLAVAGYAVRAKWRRSSVGVIPAIDLVHRRGGDDASFAESGTYRMRKFADMSSSAGDLVGDTMQRGDEAAIIRAWVQEQLRESQAAQQQQRQQQQHVQAPKKPKRFSFRLIGKSVDHFDSGVASTSKSTRSCDADDTLVRSATVRSVADVGAAGPYATGGGWMQHAATENPRAPIYKKNQPRRAAAAASDATDPSSGVPGDCYDGDEAEAVEVTADDRGRSCSLPSLPDACAAETDAGGAQAPPPPLPRGRTPCCSPAAVALASSVGDTAAEVSADVHCSSSPPDDGPFAFRATASGQTETPAAADGPGARADRDDYGNWSDREICRL